MKENAIALLAGLIFGLGLALSQMIDTARVIGFLDIAGRWDPSLLFVLGGAAGFTLISFRFVLRQPAPLLASSFRLPTKKDVDRSLIGGSALFGVGWGLAGYCPGPGVTALVLGTWNPVFFVGAFLVGSFVSGRIMKEWGKQSQTGAPVSGASAPTGA